MKRLYVLAVLSGSLVISGCRSFTSPARIHQVQQGTGYWMDYDATRRGAFMTVDSSGKMVMLSEPSPDIALDLAHKYLGKINYQEIGAEGSLELAENVVQLGKRTSTIMFLRESLYRLSELANAGKLDSETSALFKQAMQAALDLAKAEASQAEANADNAKTRKLEKIRQLRNMGLNDEQLKNFVP